MCIAPPPIAKSWKKETPLPMCQTLIWKNVLTVRHERAAFDVGFEAGSDSSNLIDIEVLHCGSLEYSRYYGQGQCLTLDSLLLAAALLVRADVGSLVAISSSIAIAGILLALLGHSARRRFSTTIVVDCRARQFFDGGADGGAERVGGLGAREHGRSRPVDLVFSL